MTSLRSVFALSTLFYLHYFVPNQCKTCKPKVINSLVSLDDTFCTSSIVSDQIFFFKSCDKCSVFLSNNCVKFKSFSDRTDHSFTLGSLAGLDDINPNPDLVHRRRSMDKVSDQ